MDMVMTWNVRRSCHAVAYLSLVSVARIEFHGFAVHRIRL